MSDLPGVGRAERILTDPALTRAEISASIAVELGQVEEMFRDNLASPVRIVDKIGEFVAEGGGKRVRPTLHLLCGRLCAYDGPHGVLLATVLEFIHSATLIHDDILDEATTRRGRPSVNVNWGNSLTVLFGDYLFAKAMELALRAENLRVMGKLAEVTLRMTEGEMLQTRYAGRVDLTEPEYLDLAERKTAALFACCCDLAGVLSDVGPGKEAALRGYGRDLGMAFQLVDDLLDFTGSAAILGKPSGSDLREGKVTLPVLDLLRRGDVRGRRLVERIIDRGDEATQELADLTELLQRTGALERAYSQAEAYAESAVRHLDLFDDGPPRDALIALPDLLLSRDR